MGKKLMQFNKACMLVQKAPEWEHFMILPFFLTFVDSDLARQVSGQTSLQAEQTAQRNLHHGKEGKSWLTCQVQLPWQELSCVHDIHYATRHRSHQC